jgi:hypothetical protein
MKFQGTITDSSFITACKKIAVHPGYVFSANDKDIHYISFNTLCNLYGIDSRSAICWDEERPQTYQGRRFEDYYHIYPSRLGLYSEFKSGRIQCKEPNIYERL